MIINFEWKKVQKLYILHKAVRSKGKNKIQKFMTESTLINVTKRLDGEFDFLFLYNEKEYEVTLIGQNSCSIKSAMFFDFGLKISGEILPYLNAFKQRYAKLNSPSVKEG